MLRRALVVSALVVTSACSSTNPTGPEDAGTDAGVTIDASVVMDAGTEVMDSGVSNNDAGIDAGYVQDPLVTARPFAEVVPVSYTASTPTPLVVLLHGYTATAATQDAYFKLSELAQTRGFLLALPNGLVDSTGQHYWNATDACCAFGNGPDDVAYLTAVINDLKARYNVDPKRVFLVGHSNGAFMANRMACDRASIIAGFVSLAGAVWSDAAKCQPSEPVNELQVHGTNDAVILYAGGTVSVPGATPYPGAETTVATWATKNHCTGTSLTAIGGNLDLVGLPLMETERYQYTGCPAGGAAELWKMLAADHIPAFNASWADTIYTWLQAHPKP